MVKSFNLSEPNAPINQLSNGIAITRLEFQGDMGMSFPSDLAYYTVFSGLLFAQYGQLQALSFELNIFATQDLIIRICDSSHNTIQQHNFSFTANQKADVLFNLNSAYDTADNFFIDFFSSSDTALKSITFYQQ